MGSGSCGTKGEFDCAEGVLGDVKGVTKGGEWMEEVRWMDAGESKTEGETCRVICGASLREECTSCGGLSSVARRAAKALVDLKLLKGPFSNCVKRFAVMRVSVPIENEV
jgi:hypothetical protein